MDARALAAITIAAMAATMLACAGGAQQLPGQAFAMPQQPLYNRASGPIPTHRFWAAKNWFPTNLTATGGAYTMFPEPLAVQTTPQGLLVGYSSHFNVAPDFYVHPVQPDLTIGTGLLNTSRVLVAAHTDRMVDFDFGPIRTRIGRGMPFVYAETTGADAIVTFLSEPTIFANQGNQLGLSVGGNDYGLFCPAHGHWVKVGLVFICRAPAGRHYISVALLPSAAAFADFARVAFVFPTATRVAYAYDRAHSCITTTFDVTTRQKEGPPAAGFLQALYPHQYTALQNTANLSTATYASARGPLRVLDAKTFTTSNVFHGLLPFLPLSLDLDRREEHTLLEQVAAEGDPFPQPDTYNTGKSLNRLAQLLPLAAMNGDPAIVSRLATALRDQFALWSAPGTRNLHRFTYDAPWGTLIGYPAAYGSNTQLNDHHFHYGYWIGSAAMLSLYDPAWLRKPENAALLHELRADIATLDTNDPRYPQLRHFDAYAGHSWASGQAPFGDGQNQESSSEAVNAWAGLALYAAASGDLRLRDAALWMYTLETNAAIDYWFNDGPVSTFPAGFDRVQIANLFDGKSDTATWFGNAPEFEHGIQFLPFSGASLYLGRDPAYVRRNLAEVTAATHGSLRTNTTFWPDLMEMYQAFDNPAGALAAWRNTAYVFDGESRAHELAWLTSLASYGQVDPTVLADTAFYAVFRSSTGITTHIAFNPGTTPSDVHFTDGATLRLPPHSLSTNNRNITLPH